MPGTHEINFKVNVSYGGSSISDQNSEETNLVMFILWGVILPPVAVIGLIGNILTIIVLWRREMHSTTILYMRGLVITDTGILIGCVLTLSPISCANYLHGDALIYFRDVIYPVIHAPAYYIVMALQQCNVWITVSVSMERYIAICHPFRASRLISRRKTLIVLATIVVISIIYNIPHIFSTKTSPCSGGGDTQPPTPKLEQNTTLVTKHEGIFGSYSSAMPPPSLTTPTTAAPVTPSWQCLELATTDFGNTHFFAVYRTFLYSIIIYIIPFLALLILNSFLIAELMVMQRRRSGTNIHDENEANLSLVLVMIVITFIICQTPGLFAQFDVIPVGIFMKYLSFSNLLFALNSAINFLIYTAFGRKFRRVLLRVFRHLFKKNRRMSQSSYRMTQYTDADFETYDTTESTTNCTMLRGMSCIKKEVKSVENTPENLPLNSNRDGSTRNGLVRNTHYTNGKNHVKSSTTDGNSEAVETKISEASEIQKTESQAGTNAIEPTSNNSSKSLAVSSDVTCDGFNVMAPQTYFCTDVENYSSRDNVSENTELIENSANIVDLQDCDNRPSSNDV